MTEANRSVVVGLLGGIGSGKSQLAALLQEAGAVVVSGDQAGHEALLEPAIRERVIETFGEGIVDENGQVERRKLGALVFANPDRRRELEALVHPWIKARLAQQVEEARRAGAPVIVLDAAIMIEAGWADLCDELVFVEVPREVRLARVRRQRNWEEEEVEARERAQLALTAKAARAQHILDNSGTLDDLRRRLGPLLRRWGLTPPG
jgi:dephospho-CoA kinase